MGLLRDRGQAVDFLGVLIAGLVAVAAAVGVGQTVVPLLLDAEFGVPAEWRGVILATFQAGAALMAFRVGRVRSRFGGRNAATGGLLLIGAGLVLSATAPNPWVVVAGLLVSGWGFGTFIPVAQGFITTASSGVYRGIAVGFWLTVVRVAQSAGPPSGTAVSDAADERLALALAAAVVTTTALLWRPLRRLQRRSAGPAERAPGESDGYREAMAQIAVAALGSGEYLVEVSERDTATEHIVTVSAAYAERLGGAAGAVALLEESFRFLLEREPKESILRRFDLPVIARYFPEYPDEIIRRMGSRGA
jgi:MFS family permease